MSVDKVCGWDYKTRSIVSMHAFSILLEIWRTRMWMNEWMNSTIIYVNIRLLHTLGCLPGLNRPKICTYSRQSNTCISPSSFWTHFWNIQCMLGIFVSQESTYIHRKLGSLNFKQDRNCMHTHNRPCFIVSSTYLIQTHLHHWNYFFFCE